MSTKGRSIFFFGLIPIVAAALTMGGRHAVNRLRTSVPSLGCTRTIDLGEKDRGEIAFGRFQIQNLGRGILTANDFSTSCSCAGVEQEVEGRISKVQSINLLPGEKCDLLVRVGVANRPGNEQLVNVSFATNDPNHPQWQINVIIRRVGGGYIAEPSAVVFGAIPLGKQSTQTINLYDNGCSGRTVREIRSTHPEHYTAILLPLSEKDKLEEHPSIGRLFARIKVTAHPVSSGRFDGELLVSLNDEKRSALPITVLGEAVSLADAHPSMLTLPRYVGSKSVCFGEVLIFNRHEIPIEVVVDSLPPEITAELHGIPDHPDQRLLNIKWHPSANRKLKQLSEVRIRLRVRSENEEMKLEVPVLLVEDRSL